MRARSAVRQAEQRPQASTGRVSWWGLTIGLLAAAGVILRLDRYLLRDSFWIDEASLAVNVAARSYGELLLPLDLAQTAPPLFLWLERSVFTVVGGAEWSLRAASFAASLATLFLLAKVGRRVLPVPAVALAFGLVALSPQVARLGSELKPYAIDALVAIVLVGLTLHAVEKPHARREWILLTIAGAFALFLSTTSPFMLAGVSVVLLVPSVRQAGVPLRRAGITLALWAGLAAVVYVVFHAPSIGSGSTMGEYFARYWEPTFLTTNPPGLKVRAGMAAGQLIVAPFPFYAAVVPKAALSASVLVGLGAAYLVRRQGLGVASLFAAPLFALGVASALQLYPIAFRLVFFATPLIALLLASGVYAAVAIAPRRIRPATFALVAATALGVSAYTTYQRLYVRSQRETRTATIIRELLAVGPATEPVYIYAGALPVWLYYASDWRKPNAARLAFMMRMGAVGSPAFNNTPSRGRRVVADGDDLVWRDGLTELVGLPPGVSNNAVQVFGERPDSGWGENEVRRIRAVANPCARAFFTHILLRTSVLEIETDLAATAAQIVWQSRNGATRAFRVCWSERGGGASASVAGRPT